MFISSAVGALYAVKYISKSDDLLESLHAAWRQWRYFVAGKLNNEAVDKLFCIEILSWQEEIKGSKWVDIAFKGSFWFWATGGI